MLVVFGVVVVGKMTGSGTPEGRETQSQRFWEMSPGRRLEGVALEKNGQRSAVLALSLSCPACVSNPREIEELQQLLAACELNKFVCFRRVNGKYNDG